LQLNTIERIILFMNDSERKAATLNAFRELDPNSEGGLYLAQVAEKVAQEDVWFMRRYNASSRIMSLFGIKRRPGDLGMAYNPKMYPAAAHFETNGVIDSDWEADSNKTHRRRIYRYLGNATLVRSGSMEK
jgi:hypothetical protein